jgi:hypothetical protein
MINVNKIDDISWSYSENWLLLNSEKRDINWLGDGNTSEKIINILKEKL